MMRERTHDMFIAKNHWIRLVLPIIGGASYYTQRDVLVAIVLSMRWTYAYSLGVAVGGGIPSRGVGYPSKFGVN